MVRRSYALTQPDTQDMYTPMSRAVGSHYTARSQSAPLLRAGFESVGLHKFNEEGKHQQKRSIGNIEGLSTSAGLIAQVAFTTDGDRKPIMPTVGVREAGAAFAGASGRTSGELNASSIDHGTKRPMKGAGSPSGVDVALYNRQIGGGPDRTSKYHTAWAVSSTKAASSAAAPSYLRHLPPDQWPAGHRMSLSTPSSHVQELLTAGWAAELQKGSTLDENSLGLVDAADNLPLQGRIAHQLHGASDKARHAAREGSPVFGVHFGGRAASPPQPASAAGSAAARRRPRRVGMAATMEVAAEVAAEAVAARKAMGGMSCQTRRVDRGAWANSGALGSTSDELARIRIRETGRGPVLSVPEPHHRLPLVARYSDGGLRGAGVLPSRRRGLRVDEPSRQRRRAFLRCRSRGGAVDDDCHVPSRGRYDAQ